VRDRGAKKEKEGGVCCRCFDVVKQPRGAPRKKKCLQING